MDDMKLTQVQEVFNFLTLCASQGRITNYKEVALAVGLPSSGNQLGSTLGPILAKILNWCEDNKLPPLTSLVVYKTGGDMGIPGGKFWELLGINPTTSNQVKHALIKVYHQKVFNTFSGLV